MKKFLSLLLTLTMGFSLCACGDKEDTKTEKPNNEVVSQETEKAETDNNSLVGTWVVTKTEAYDGPYKTMVEPALNADYYVGAEYEFTDDGICKKCRWNNDYNL